MRALLLARRRVPVAVAGLAVGLAAGGAGAQEAATLAGRVTVAGAGDPVAGAEVEAVCHARATTTGADGSWRLGPLPAGRHELRIRHLGFAPRVVEARTAAAVPLRVELTPSPVALSAVVVTASRRLQALRDVPVATEVLDRAELRRTGSADLAAVLVERTGVTAEGGHPVGSGIMLQGLGSERVLVLLDGQPMLGRLSGRLDLSRVPVSMIERVEVVKGPQSTLYGSEAMGGVVNVVTRAPESGVWKGGVDVVAGSRERLDVGAHVLGGLGGVAYGADAGRRSVELVPGHRGDAGTFATRWDGAAKVQWRADSTLSLSAGGIVLDESQRWKSGVLYHFADNLQWGARVGASWRRGAHRFAPTLYATGFGHLSRRSTRPAPVEGSGEEERQRLLEAELLYAGALGGVAVDAGVEARRDAIRSDRVQGGGRALHTVEPFAQATVSGERWSVVPGARLTWSEQWGTHFTPRLAALIRPVPRVAVRASVGRGFRAPSFKELYMEFLNTGAGAGYRVRGNPALLPETSNNATASVEWAGDRLYARGQLFYNRFDDFIETVELADSGGLRLFTYENIDDGVTWGSELELGAAWRGLRAEAGYGYLVAEERGTGAALPGRPTHSGRASLSYAAAIGLRATLTGVYTGRTLVERGGSEEVVRDGFPRFDLRLSQALPGGLELSAGVDNIADARPEHWPGFVSRQLHLGLGWRAERDGR